MSAISRTARRGIAVAALAVAALTTAAAADAAQIVADAGGDRGCYTRATAMTSNPSTVVVEGLFNCVGPVTQTLTVKRNGAIIYQATVGSTWSNVYSQAPLPAGYPIGFKNYFIKQFGQCVRGAAYQVVATYTTGHVAIVTPYSGVISTGAPRVLC